MKQCSDVKKKILFGNHAFKVVYIASPAPNSISEKSASTMTLIGNWLCKTMTKERFNHVMLLLSIDQESTNVLELIDIVKMFCEENAKNIAF